MKFRPTLADGASGSLGGMTASHNRGGYYFRTRSVPTNPNSIRQQAVRSNFGTLVQYWTATLTPAERAAWTGYADSTPVTNVLGDPILLTGQQMFIRSNTVRLQIGAAIVVSAPTMNNTGEPPTDVTGPSAEAMTIGVNSGVTAFDGAISIAGGASADGDTVLYLGPNQNASVNFYKGPYQLAIATAITTDDLLASLTQMLDTLSNDNGPLAEGQVRPVRIRNMYDDGRLSQPFEALLPVLAATE